MIGDIPDRCRAIAGVLERLANVAGNRRGNAFQFTSYRQSAALLRDQATTIDNGEVTADDIAALRGALEGVRVDTLDV